MEKDLADKDAALHGQKAAMQTMPGSEEVRNSQTDGQHKEKENQDDD
jgi:hypothetical protein